VGQPNSTESKVYQMRVISMGQLESELGKMMDEIKRRLEDLLRFQDRMRSKTREIDAGATKEGALSPERRTELSLMERDQNSITRDLAQTRREIVSIRRRGTYNLLFDEVSTGRLTAATEILDRLAGENLPVQQVALSRWASHLLSEAGRAQDGAVRHEKFLEAGRTQEQVSDEISKVLQHLERWASYQEIVRLTRDLLHRQQQNERNIQLHFGD
jgi:hypothetical protein